MNRSLILCIVLFLAVVHSGFACKCLPPTVYSSARVYADVIKAYVHEATTSPSPDLYAWNATVEAVYKGCITTNSSILVLSPTTPAACGVNITSGASYLLTGNRRVNNTKELIILSCSMNLPWYKLRDTEKTFVYDLENPCTGRCATGGHVHCFVQPCKVSTCSIAGAICEDNYCNGCHAYWWTPRDERICF